MMIKITEKCSMGCSHCMNRATCNGKHMNFDTFIDVIEFQRKYGGPFCFITGGEPFEHPEFVKFLLYARQQLPQCFFTIATNGVALQNSDMDYFVRYLGSVFPPVLFQVCNDTRYYPTSIDVSLPVFHLPTVTLITEVPKLYPQGRTLDNGLSWTAKGSKCFNIRAVTHQLDNPTLSEIIMTLALKDKIYTPHISINGDIKLGESDLCPVCSSIYKSQEEIVNDILNFKCHNCDHVNCKLDSFYRHLIGE